MLPVAHSPDESIIVLLDWFSGHLTHEVREIIERKGHVSMGIKKTPSAKREDIVELVQVAWVGIDHKGLTCRTPRTRRRSECGQSGSQPDAGVAFELSTPNGVDDPFAFHAMRLKALCLKNIYENIHEHLLHEMFQNKRQLQRPRRVVLTVNRQPERLSREFPGPRPITVVITAQK